MTGAWVLNAPPVYESEEKMSTKIKIGITTSDAERSGWREVVLGVILQNSVSYFGQKSDTMSQIDNWKVRKKKKKPGKIE